MDTEQAKTVKDKKAVFEAELKRKRRLAVLNTVAVLFLLFLVYLMLVASPSNPILRALGIRNFVREKGGLYADCSKRENKGKGFCDGISSTAEKNWKTVKRPGSGREPLFNLN